MSDQKRTYPIKRGHVRKKKDLGIGIIRKNYLKEIDKRKKNVLESEFEKSIAMHKNKAESRMCKKVKKSKPAKKNEEHLNLEKKKDVVYEEGVKQ